jgi:hypothetical protein
MIHGAHVILYSKSPEADRAFFKDVLKYPYSDAGHGWLIFALPPAEIAVHPTDGDERHELYLMCDDVQAFVGEMAAKNVACGPVQEQRWGLLTSITLPGAGTLGVYEPRHASPLKKAAPSAPRRARASVASKKSRSSKTSKHRPAGAKPAKASGGKTRKKRT